MTRNRESTRRGNHGGNVAGGTSRDRPSLGPRDLTRNFIRAIFNGATSLDAAPARANYAKVLGTRAATRFREPQISPGKVRGAIARVFGNSGVPRSLRDSRNPDPWPDRSVLPLPLPLPLAEISS